MEDTMVKEITDALVPAITEQVMEKMRENMPAAQPILSADEKAYEQKVGFADGLKKLESKAVKALTTGSSTAGSELAPTYVANEVSRVAAATGLVDRLARKVPMMGSKENIPTADSVTAYRVNEGSKITTSAPTTGAIALSSKTVGVIVPFSRKLLQNATPAVTDMLLMLAGEAMATLKDKWALLGLASGEGVLQHASVPGVTLGSGKTTYDKVTPEDLLDMIDKVDENISADRLRWVMSRSGLNILRRVRAMVSTDAQEFLFQGFGTSTPPAVWDIPYNLSPVMPKKADSSQAGKKFMALVDWSRVLLGEDQPITFEMSEQATITDTDGSTLINLFEQNMVAIKVSTEIDIQLAQPDKGFAWIKTAAS
jgi:HK97 family phage major capsid protein